MARRLDRRFSLSLALSRARCPLTRCRRRLAKRSSLTSVETSLTKRSCVILLTKHRDIDCAHAQLVTEPNDVLVNRKGSALRPKCHAIASDILSLATSILNHEAVPRSLLRNGKRSFQDLTAWRASEKCTDQATAASQEANAYSQQQSTLTREQSQHRRLEVTPMPTAQSIASFMIAKDVYELKTKMDDLQRRMSRVESLSSPAIIKNELQQIKSVVSNMSAMQTQKPEHHNVTTETQTTNSHVLSRQLLDERPVNQSFTSRSTLS